MATITRRRLRLRATDYADDASEPRSDGAHVSAIIWSMEQDMLKALGGSRKEGLPQEQLEDFARLGFLWEHVLSSTWAGLEFDIGLEDKGTAVLQPGEFGWCVDCEETMAGKQCARHCKETGHHAIYATPDSVFVTTYKDELGEYKSTWKSQASAVTPKEGEDLEQATEWVEDRTMEMGQWRWMMQVKCYCFLLCLDSVLFRVLFVNGKYNPPFPATWEFRVEFSQDEINSAWRGVVHHAAAKGWV